MEGKRLPGKDLSASLAGLASRITDYLADRRGVPLIIGFVCVLLNFFLQFVPALRWFADYDVMLHLGVLLAIAGSLLSSAL